MAQLSQAQKNLIEVALDAPLNDDDIVVIDAIAQEILQEGPEDELEQLKSIKVNLLIAERVNKLKEAKSRV
jgi:hypothetical protein